MRFFSTLSLAFLGVLLTGCGQSHDDGVHDNEAHEAGGHHATACESDGMTAAHAWVRPAREGQKMSAGYLTLCNGGEDDALVSVSFDGADAAELHLSMTDENGVASMTPQNEIALPTDKHVVLEPGGAHIMLIGLSDPLEENGGVEMQLTFKNAPSQTVRFEIRQDAPEEHLEGHH